MTKQKTDGRQIEMTQECEKILNAAEKIQQEKSRHKFSYHSQEEEPVDIMREYEEHLAQF